MVKFKDKYNIRSNFHHNPPPFSPKAWQINNYLTMNLMKGMFKYIGTKGLVITNIFLLRSKTMIDKDEYDTIDNDISNSDNSFQSGSSHVDVNIPQTMIDLENVVDDTFVTTGTFYK